MQTMIYGWLGVMVIIPVGFYLFFKNKSKAALGSVDFEAEKLKAADYQSELLSGECSYLKDWMENSPIDAFTTASVPASISDHAKGMAKDFAKSVAWAAVGVKAKYKRVETPSFLVLSNNELHYFSTTAYGEMDQHLIFDKATLEASKLNFLNPVQAAKTQSNSSPNDFWVPIELQLNLPGADGATLNVHDRINQYGDISGFTNSKSFMEMSLKRRIVGYQFLKKLGDTYPNFKVLA